MNKLKKSELDDLNEKIKDEEEMAILMSYIRDGIDHENIFMARGNSGVGFKKHLSERLDARFRTMSLKMLREKRSELQLEILKFVSMEFREEVIGPLKNPKSIRMHS